MIIAFGIYIEIFYILIPIGKPILNHIQNHINNNSALDLTYCIGEFLKIIGYTILLNITSFVLKVIFVNSSVRE